MAVTAYREAFAFLRVGIHESKPRATGLTCVLDGMDNGFMTAREISELGEFTAGYIDWLKLGWTISRYVPEEKLIEKVRACHEQEISVYMGGIALEVALLQGRLADFIAACARYEIDAVEVSASVAYVNAAAKRDAVARIRDAGLRAFVELGRKDDAGKLTVADVERELRLVHDVGASKLLVESERLAELDAAGTLDSFIEECAQLDHQRLTFELPYGLPFAELQPIASRLIGILGPTVNLANVDPRHVMGLETVRTGTCFGPLFGLLPTATDDGDS